MMNKLSLLVTVVLAACCCSEQDPVREASTVEITGADTIGVDTGNENFVFGDICGVDTDAEGNILVLDGVNCTVKVFSPDGAYVGSFGGIGSGPGEFLEPLDIAVLSDGGIAVADWEAWGIFYFDSEYRYERFLGPMAGGAPLALTGGSESSVTGLGLLFWNENNLPVGEYYLGSWSDLPEESFRFLEGSAEVVPGEGGEISISYPAVAFDSDNSGNLFAALSTDSTFIIQRFSGGGELVAEIKKEWERVPLDSEIRSGMEEAALLVSDSDSEIPLYSNAVAGVFCDPFERVWVRLGTCSSPLFNVYSYQGELINTVSCPELSDPLFELDFHFSGSKVYIWNTDPVDYPKVLVMDNPL